MAGNHGPAGPRLGWLLPIPVLFHGSCLWDWCKGAGLHAAVRSLFTLLICSMRKQRPRARRITKGGCNDWEFARWPGGARRRPSGWLTRHESVGGSGAYPGASTNILVQSILSIAFAEAIVFYALFLVR